VAPPRSLSVLDRSSHETVRSRVFARPWMCDAGRRRLESMPHASTVRLSIPICDESWFREKAGPTGPIARRAQPRAAVRDGRLDDLESR
jgi:hypothetical protein